VRNGKGDSVMLKVASLYKEQLDKICQEIAFDERFKFYINDMGPGMNFEIKTAWQELQFVSVNKDDTVIGIFEASIVRQSNIVNSFRTANFTGKPNSIYSQDLQQFFIDLFMKFNLSKVIWYVHVGNPAELIYDKFINHHGGRVVGVFKEDSRLWDGRLYDLKAYEILKREFCQE
jgi:hypothetical protein